MFSRFAQLIFVAFLLWLPNAMASVAISSARVWPAQDYTRLTLESKQAIHYKWLTLKNPERLVIDLDDVDLTPALNELGTKFANDPYIKSVRVARFKPGVVRMVLDLKTEAKPQLFNLKPVAEYGHRLVLDVYPVIAIDPLMALAQQAENKTTEIAATKTAVSAASSVAASAPPAVTEPKVQTATIMPTLADKIEKSAPLKRTEISTRILIVAVDAGHGGEDPGAQGRRGTHEKNVTLAIARKLKDQIDNTPGMRAVLIRDGDYFIPLGGRVEKARKAHADLFVSIHADAFVKPHARGSSVFALSERGATSASARWLAKKENEADLIGGVNLAIKDPYLARTLLDLSQTATINDSMKVAKHVLRELGGINTLHRGFVEQAGFAVLKSPDIPSILVETAFISNPEEEQRLGDDEYREKLAGAILVGIKRYFSQNPALSKPQIAQN
ncbi:MAG: N-acetylmuramoyl-L-alanine amidase [Gallionellaceae bacterium]|jgi:N-acetylmuramoyl-L-alanine amidase